MVIQRLHDYCTWISGENGANFWGNLAEIYRIYKSLLKMGGSKISIILCSLSIPSSPFYPCYGRWIFIWNNNCFYSTTHFNYFFLFSRNNRETVPFIILFNPLYMLHIHYYTGYMYTYNMYSIYTVHNVYSVYMYTWILYLNRLTFFIRFIYFPPNFWVLIIPASPPQKGAPFPWLMS